MLTADPSARATYGDDAHRCAFCSARQTSRDPLTPATARQALASGVAEGDLLCTVCDAGFTADADAMEATAPRAPGACDECGRRMVARRGPTCSVCLARWFASCAVTRGVGEGPQPATRAA